MEQKTYHFTSTRVRVHRSQFLHGILDRLWSMALLTGSNQAHLLVYLDKLCEAIEKMMDQ